ncbi:hypothetical protein SEA_REDFOX_61 [Arthrobacter phage RedFox]|nr:hypothetical protein SEA_REDFOX_61 [Arthrobacter phage RedFox]
MDEALRHHAAASRGYAGAVADSRRETAAGPELALAALGRAFLEVLDSVVAGAASDTQADYSLAGPSKGGKP